MYILKLDTSNMDMEGIGALGDIAMQTLRDMTKEELKERSVAIANTTIAEIQNQSDK